MMSWGLAYVNIPYRDFGRGRDGVDCYGLVRLIYREQLRVDLPDYTEGYATIDDRKEIAALMRGEVATRWKEIDVASAKPYDGLIFRIKGQPAHFGILMDSPCFLHALKEEGAPSGRVRQDRLDSLLWTKRLVMAVRYDQ